jgi:mRNA interferase MazF
MSTTIQRGDIYLVDLEPIKGKEQGKTRPCVVVQNDIGNIYSPVTIIVACTSRGLDKVYPTDVLIDASETGSRSDSKVLCNQIRTVDKTRLLRKLGSVPLNKMNMIDARATAVVTRIWKTLEDLPFR